MSKEPSFIVKNLSPGIRLGLPPGTAREYTAEELGAIAEVVARQMQPVAQVLENGTQNVGGTLQPISVPVMRPAPHKHGRVACVLVEDGKEQEISSKDLLALFEDQIKARKAGRVAAAQKRRARAAEQAEKLGL